MRQLKIQTAPTFRTSESINKYLNEISRIPLISIDEEIELAQKIRKGGREGEMAKKKLVTANLRFVVSVAKQYQHKGLTLTDLIEEGNIGLMKAAERFDETRGFKFISYAVWWIRQSILQAVAEQSSIVHLPFNQVNNLNMIDQVIRKFEQENQRQPSASELSELTNLDEKSINNAMMAHKYPVSMDLPLQEDEKTTVGEMMAGTERTDHQLDIDSLNTDIKDVLKSILSLREITILCESFGINSQMKSYEEIGARFNLSSERVRQIKERCLKKIRNSEGIDVLRKYLN